ncbi:hypothetical protein AG1IA_09267 [Rhizoctonia solani AG-1 IA]|uniref:Uncharacterized protein n=1 Tax=Thanatephorus cucumeris (strain AG1-IA) TaxID=983506 RepID=L8WFG6_THACA|nr:hypothetical protein AG1IA_09267 [Rhizoctonia solani AG-1 IA]
MDIPDDEKKLKYPLLNNLEPSDAYNDSPAWKRAVDKFETRLDSKALQPTAKVHQTLRDIKQEMKRAHGTHRQLTFSDLLALKWNIQTGLVQCNTLERLKQSLSVVSGWHRYEAYRLITISGRSNIQRTTTERSYKSFVNALILKQVRFPLDPSQVHIDRSSALRIPDTVPNRPYVATSRASVVNQKAHHIKSRLDVRRQ